MMPFTRFVLLLILCGTVRSGFGIKLYKINDSYTCNELLSEVGKAELPDDPSVEKRSFTYLASDRSAFPADKQKRIFPAARYKYLRRTQLKGKMYQNTAKSNRRTKFTLSLDVPMSLLNILLNIAKAKNMRAKAAANARLMAQIGRRK